MFLPIVLVGYLFNCISILFDKVVVEKSVSSPLVYTFYVGVLGLLSLLLIPFGFTLPGWYPIIFSVLAGISYIFGLYTLYVALKAGQASIVSTVIGALNAVFTLVIATFIFAGDLSSKQILASVVLIIGLSILPSHSLIKTRLERSHLLLMVASGIFYALGAIFLKEAFNHTSFLNGLILTYGANGVLLLPLLLFPQFRRMLQAAKPTHGGSLHKSSLPILASQISGATAGVLITYAYSLTSPAIVNSLRGVQYIFLFLIVYLLPKRFRLLFHEELNKVALIHKVVGIVIIMVGLYILAR